MEKKVLITGGKGLVARRLVSWLAEDGWDVALLSRGRPTPWSQVPVFHWDPLRGMVDEAALPYAEHLIHLAGAGMGERRWTPQRKKKIIDSRVKSLDTLREAIDKAGMQVRTLISASGIGYYGSSRTGHRYVETDPPGEDFPAMVCRIWEAAAGEFTKPGSRVVTVRTGLVLSGEGGALPRLAFLARMGLGAPLGTGKQAFPWIHIDDLCRIYCHLLDEPGLEGPFNAVAPESVSNRDFSRALNHQLHRPNILPPIPHALLRLVQGEMASMLTGGSPVSGERIQASGYSFLHPGLEEALDHISKKQSRKK